MDSVSGPAKQVQFSPLARGYARTACCRAALQRITEMIAFLAFSSPQSLRLVKSGTAQLQSVRTPTHNAN
jgi:hypothetical protein